MKTQLMRRSRFRIHFILDGSSWPSVIERWFPDLVRTGIRGGVFKSVEQLEQTIGDYVNHHNARPQSFVRTKKAKDMGEKATRAGAALKKF